MHGRSRSICCSLLLAASALLGCQATPPGKAAPTPKDSAQTERMRMVREQIQARGIRSPGVLQALRSVPREVFVPAPERDSAYGDSALPIGYGQTISQPYIVALMTELLAPHPGEKIFEVGTGSGYQAAVLAQMGARVYTVEIVAPLAARARRILRQQGYGDRVSVRAGDGFLGWPEAAPFDGIILTCAVDRVPPPLIAQLKPGGRMVLPLGESLDYQTLTVVTKSSEGKLTFRDVTGVVFVPMTGPHGFGNR